MHNYKVATCKCVYSKKYLWVAILAYFEWGSLEVVHLAHHVAGETLQQWVLKKVDIHVHIMNAWIFCEGNILMASQ
jgi:hypothetical protein